MCANTKGLEVVVAKEVQAEAHHAVCDIAVETDCFPVVVREVFAQLPVDVVGRKKGIAERPGQLRADRPVDEAGVFSLRAEGCKPMEHALIVGLFIGDEDKGPVGSGGCSCRACTRVSRKERASAPRSKGIRR